MLVYFGFWPSRFLKTHYEQVGSLVVSRVTSYTATWVALVILLVLHLSLNYSAVRSVQMTSLNRQRANIVFSTLLESDPDFAIESFHDSHHEQEGKSDRAPSQTSRRILSPAEVAQQERIFEKNGILRWSLIGSSSSETSRLGFCRIGISVQQFLASCSSSHTSSGSLRPHLPVSRLFSIFQEESYILILHSVNQTWYAEILSKNTCNTQAQLKAWAHALLAARVLSTTSREGGSTIDFGSILNVISTTLGFLNEDGRFDQYLLALTHAGWDVSLGALETNSGRRVICSE